MNGSRDFNAVIASCAHGGAEDMHGAEEMHGAENSCAGSRNGKLHFNIRRLTLHGYSRADQARFTRTLRAELAKLSAKATPGDPRIERLDAGEMGSGVSPEEAARRIARRIAERLGHHDGASRNV
jgi:hypothetical protein